MTMKAETYEITRTVKLPNGEELEKAAKLYLNLPDSLEELKSTFTEEQIRKWAIQGITEYSKAYVRMKLGGGSEDGRKNKLLRQFNGHVATLVEIQEMSQEDAVAILLAKTKFQPLIAHFESLRNTDLQVFDFRNEVPEPRWFAGDESEDPDTEDDSDDQDETDEEESK